MHKLKLTLVAGITALTLIAVPAAGAQSSLSSEGSSTLGSSTTQPLTPAEANLKALYDRQFEAGGLKKDARSEKEADSLVERAVAGELSFYANTATVGGLRFTGYVERYTHEQVAALEDVEIDRHGFNNAFGLKFPFGTAVASDDEYVYIAVAFSYLSFL